MDLHPNLADLAPLLGSFTGEGSGDYPTIEGFTYREQVAFEHVGKPFLAYTQRTRDPEGAPLHSEAGYLRALGDGRVEWVIAMPTGHAEVATGSVTVDDHALVIEVSGPVYATPAAKEAREIRRRIRLAGDELAYTVDMAAVGQPLQRHLVALLHRED